MDKNRGDSMKRNKPMYQNLVTRFDIYESIEKQYYETNITEDDKRCNTSTCQED